MKALFLVGSVSYVFIGFTMLSFCIKTNQPKIKNFGLSFFSIIKVVLSVRRNFKNRARFKKENLNYSCLVIQLFTLNTVLPFKSFRRNNYWRRAGMCFTFMTFFFTSKVVFSRSFLLFKLIEFNDVFKILLLGKDLFYSFHRKCFAWS